MIPKKVYTFLTLTIAAQNSLLLMKHIEVLKSKAIVLAIPVRVNVVAETITNPLQLCTGSIVF